MQDFKTKLESEGEIFLRIKVLPRSNKTEFVEMREDNSLKIRLKAVPEKGKANKELIKFLSEEFKTKKENILIISGQTAQIKLVKISQ